MCGIVGLHLRTPELVPPTGGAAHRDAVRDGRPRQRLGRRRRLRRSDLVTSGAWVRLGARCRPTTATWPRPSPPSSRPVDGEPVDATYLLSAGGDVEVLLDAVEAAYPRALVAGFGGDMAVLKGVGHPRKLTEAWGLAKAQGWQGVGHTRMATESAVTPAGCHPYAVGPEQCMVHNGSFANHATIRRELHAGGVQFDSENDTEVGARFIAQAVGRRLATWRRH